MAYINRLSDINNKLDTNIENQIESNSKLANIDDNVATLNTNIKNSFDSTNNALKVNVVVGGGNSDGKALLYNGDGDTAITATALSATKNGIDTASAMYVSNGTDITALTATTVDASKKGIDTASSMYVTTGGTRTAITATTLLDAFSSVYKNCIDTTTSIYGINSGGRYQIGATGIDQTTYGLNTASSIYALTTPTTRTALTATLVNTTGSIKTGLDTASSLYVTDGTTRTALTATSAALDVNIKNSTINRLGVAYNILDGALAANSYSTEVDITGYSNCILSYEDTQNLTDTILIFGSINNTDFFYIGAVLPIYYANFIGTAKRFASTKLDLASIKYIKIYNSSLTNITAGKCTLVSA